MLGDILFKVDKMSMVNFLELWVLFLDKEVMNVVFYMLIKYFFNYKGIKWVFWMVVNWYLLEEWVIWLKMGFLVLICEWFYEDKYY